MLCRLRLHVFSQVCQNYSYTLKWLNNATEGGGCFADTVYSVQTGIYRLRCEIEMKMESERRFAFLDDFDLKGSGWCYSYCQQNPWRDQIQQRGLPPACQPVCPGPLVKTDAVNPIKPTKIQLLNTQTVMSFKQGKEAYASMAVHVIKVKNVKIVINSCIDVAEIPVRDISTIFILHLVSFSSKIAVFTKHLQDIFHLPRSFLLEKMTKGQWVPEKYVDFCTNRGTDGWFYMQLYDCHSRTPSAGETFLISSAAAAAIRHISKAHKLWKVWEVHEY